MNPQLNFAFPTLFSLIKLVLMRSTPAVSVVVGTFATPGAAQKTSAARSLSARLLSAPTARLDRCLSRERPQPAAAPQRFTFNEDATTIERRAFERTNEERLKAGLAPLVWDADLCRMARIHSESMARMNSLRTKRRTVCG